MITCQYCKKEYTNKYTLTTHQKKTRACLALQNKSIEKDFKCADCDLNVTTKQTLQSHHKICTKRSLRILQEEHDEIIHQKDLVILKFKRKNRELRKTIDKLMKKPIIVNNNDNRTINNTDNRTTNNTDNRSVNIKTYIKNNCNAITKEVLDKHKEELTLDHILNGGRGLAMYALKYPLSEAPMICTDRTRHTFRYKVHPERVLEDPHLTIFMPMFFSSIKENVKDIMLRFIDELNLDPAESDSMSQELEYVNIIKDVNYSSVGTKSDVGDDFVRHLGIFTRPSLVIPKT